MNLQTSDQYGHLTAQWFLFPKPFINIKFHGNPSAERRSRETIAGLPVEVPGKTEAQKMRKAVLALATAVTIGVSAFAAPTPAQAWRGGGWGWGPGLAAGLVGAAVIGGIASSAYAYGPGYGYYGGPGYGYYGGYGPGYYGGYAPAYYGGYYYGPRYRRAIRPAYAYGPRYYRGYPYRW